MANQKEITRKEDTVTLRKDFIKCWVHANPSFTQGKASALYDAMCNRFPEMSRGGHRGMVGRLQPWETVNHECPCCGLEANGLQNIKANFGLRLLKYTTKEGTQRKLYYQSWCRDCRKKRRSGGTNGVRINPEVQSGFTNSSSAAQ